MIGTLPKVGAGEIIPFQENSSEKVLDELDVRVTEIVNRSHSVDPVFQFDPGCSYDLKRI